MAIKKVMSSFSEAVADIPDGEVIMVGGFGGQGGMPSHLLLAFRDQSARGLTIIANSGGLQGLA